MKIQLIGMVIALMIALPVMGFSNATEDKNHQVHQDDEKSHELYIDPRIQLTKNSVHQLENECIKTFTQLIIETIKKNGNADSTDILQIVKGLELETTIKSIHFFCLLRSDGRGYAYANGFLPFLFLLIFNEFIIDDAYLGPALLVQWQSPDANTRINGKKIYDDDQQQGYGFGFIGHSYAGGTWPAYYHVFGLSMLVIIMECETSF